MQPLTRFQDELRAIRRELDCGMLSRQDALINRWLARYLDASAERLIPSAYRSECEELLGYYARNVLPLRLSPELATKIGDHVRTAIARLQAQREIVNALETRFEALVERFRTKTFRTAAALCQALNESVGATTPLRKERHFERQYRELRAAPLTAARVTAFFAEAVQHGLSEQALSSYLPMELLFWDQLAELFYPPAVLLDLVKEHAEIFRFETFAELGAPAEQDGVIFDDDVDNAMRQSCKQALQAVRHYLDGEVPDMLAGRAIRVTCRFQHPLKTYCDTSVSLLMAIKTIGDLLKLDIHPDIVITGELDECGVVRPVGFIDQKLDAVERHSGIRQLYLPADSRVERRAKVSICAVRHLQEAAQQYYGNALKERKCHVSRRNFLIAAAGFAVGTATTGPTLLLAKNLFSPSVSEHDWQLAEYARIQYQTRSDYSVISILKALLEQVRGKDDTDAIRLKALCFREFGVIYLQQHHIQEALAAMRNALTCWQTIHDGEHLADACLSLGEAYRYLVGIEGREADAHEGFVYYQRAFDALHRKMPLYHKLAGKYYALAGCLHDELGQHELAEQFGRRSLEVFEPIETNWTYQTCRQHVGRMLIHSGKYDEAHHLITSTMRAAVLQSPYYQVRGYWTLADLRLSTNDLHGGMEALHHAEQLCQQYNFPGQRRMIEKIAWKHEVKI
ncbi:predicted ATP-dependent serine protease [Candidatus Moduliflexus flocculans]|uniref:Predicted ATP-dependent serine protease n=1 Tax=Candidatus Moduliflexus flocculans TaxID=1499966 RepID=A0A0S6VSY6_9BACT|nr:predicted ATP-dependent serine protease [Candidatus Moduliflexus flocculans]